MKRKRILQKLANCISYDIKEGIVRFIPLYALTGVFVLAFGWDARMHLAENVPAPSVLDLAVYMFQGMDEYVYVKGGPPFDIPISFLTLSFCFALFACYYAHREWKLRGTVYIPRYESKMYFLDFQMYLVYSPDDPVISYDICNSMGNCRRRRKHIRPVKQGNPCLPERTSSVRKQYGLYKIHFWTRIVYSDCLKPDPAYRPDDLQSGNRIYSGYCRYHLIRIFLPILYARKLLYAS